MHNPRLTERVAAAVAALAGVVVVASVALADHDPGHSGSGGGVTFCSDPCTGSGVCPTGQLKCCCDSGTGWGCACQTASYCQEPPSGTNCR